MVISILHLKVNHQKILLWFWYYKEMTEYVGQGRDVAEGK